MRTKLKIALCILLAITALLLIVSYAMIFASTNGLVENTEPEEREAVTTEIGNALGEAIGLGITLVLLLILGVSWLTTALMMLIFVPIVGAAKTDKKMHKVLKALLICTVIFSVGCAISMLISMILCFSFASYFLPLIVTMDVSGVFLLATFITVIVSYAKFHKYYVNLPIEQPIVEQPIVEQPTVE